MHSTDEISMVLSLLEAGLNDCKISRRTGIPRRTILDWRHGRVPGKRPRQIAAQVPGQRRLLGDCDVCSGRLPHPPETPYAYLLGLYLGDGCISKCPRTYRIRIALDLRYPGIIKECVAALEAIRPGKRAGQGQYQASRCVEVGMYWNHWPCLIPQHGPGRKHLRRIVLEPWQQAIVGRQHMAFLRSLIHSDGCRVIANDRGVMSVRYHFSNKSEDIKGLYCASLDALGIGWTRPCDQQIAVYRKESVAKLDRFIGPKR